jgi:hypothetical protein
VQVSGVDTAQGGKTEVDYYILETKGGPLWARQLAPRSTRLRQIPPLGVSPFLPFASVWKCNDLF